MIWEPRDELPILKSIVFPPDRMRFAPPTFRTEKEGALILSGEVQFLPLPLGT